MYMGRTRRDINSDNMTALVLVHWWWNSMALAVSSVSSEIEPNLSAAIFIVISHPAQSKRLTKESKAYKAIPECANL